MRTRNAKGSTPERLRGSVCLEMRTKYVIQHSNPLDRGQAKIPKLEPRGIVTVRSSSNHFL